jgi:hypothetical protein
VPSVEQRKFPLRAAAGWRTNRHAVEIFDMKNEKRLSPRREVAKERKEIL